MVEQARRHDLERPRDPVLELQRVGAPEDDAGGPALLLALVRLLLAGGGLHRRPPGEAQVLHGIEDRRHGGGQNGALHHVGRDGGGGGGGGRGGGHCSWVRFLGWVVCVGFWVLGWVTKSEGAEVRKGRKGLPKGTDRGHVGSKLGQPDANRSTTGEGLAKGNGGGRARRTSSDAIVHHQRATSDTHFSPIDASI